MATNYTREEIRLRATDPDFNREAILGSLRKGEDRARRFLDEGNLEAAARAVIGLIEEGETGPTYFTDAEKAGEIIKDPQLASDLLGIRCRRIRRELLPEVKMLVEELAQKGYTSPNLSLAYLEQVAA